jgi:hypothetical protein
MSDCCDQNSSKSKDLLINEEGLICYCFKKSKQELLACLEKGEEQQFIGTVKAKMKDPGCFCERANPSGKCCLGDIQAFIHETKEK